MSDNEAGCGQKRPENSCRDGELDRSRIYRALVSEKDGGARTTSLVRAAFRNGGSQFDLLFGPGRTDRRTLVREHAGRF